MKGKDRICPVTGFTCCIVGEEEDYEAVAPLGEIPDLRRCCYRFFRSLPILARLEEAFLVLVDDPNTHRSYRLLFFAKSYPRLNQRG